MSPIHEFHVEEANLDWLGELGYERLHGPDISPDGDEAGSERGSFEEVLLRSRLEVSLARINPNIPAHALDDKDA